MYKLIEKIKGEKDKTFPLKGIVHEIGRASSCDISLADNNKASRIHARLEKDSDGWWIVDLNSTNGTFINKERVKSKRLETGDEITIGDSSLLFLIDKGDEIINSDTSTEFEQPRLNIKIQDEIENKKWTQHLFILIFVILILSVSLWFFYSLYIGKMNKIHRTADMINIEIQKMELIYGDIETSKRIVFNLGLIKGNMPAIIDFMAKVQDNSRIFNEIKKESPDVTLIAVKIGLDNAVEFEQQINSYLKTIQQILDATESFKKAQDRKSYNALIKSSSSAVNELDKSREIFLKYNDELSRLNALLVSLDKVSSKIVPSLSRNTGIILDASNKIKDDLLRLINNMKIEKAFLLIVMGQ